MEKVLYEEPRDIPIDEDEERNNTSYEDNDEIRNGEESHNGEISSEDTYNPNFHSYSTDPPQQSVYKL